MSSTTPVPGSPGHRLAMILRRESSGGILLLATTAIALIWANSPGADSYFALRDLTIGPAVLQLDLTVGEWAADGLLAVFFFVVGLELKHEFVLGSLRNPRRALVPIAAAIGGVIGPAVVYLVVMVATGASATQGWAVPTATDIAFAVAVLAVAGRGLPPAVRTFLLTLAVVDDLIAITIIAVVYTAGLELLPLALALVPLGAFALLTRRGVTRWWVLVPLGVLTWALVHASGVHATVAGVLLGLAVPAGLANRFAHRWTPLSTGFAVPVFALFAAGVAVGGLSGLIDSIGTPVAVAIIAGLVLGKTIGVLAATLVATRLGGIQLDGTVRWADIGALAPLTGVGFTVALLVGDLAFGASTPLDDQVKVGVLAGSLIAALLGGSLVAVQARRHAVGTTGRGETNPDR